MPKFAKTLEELKRIGAESEVSRDALLWREGDRGDEVVVLLEGLFDVVREGPEGEPVVIRTLDAGAILGEMSALDGHARSAAVRAGTPPTRAWPRWPRWCTGPRARATSSRGSATPASWCCSTGRARATRSGWPSGCASGRTPLRSRAPPPSPAGGSA